MLPGDQKINAASGSRAVAPKRELKTKRYKNDLLKNTGSKTKLLKLCRPDPNGLTYQARIGIFHHHYRCTLSSLILK